MGAADLAAAGAAVRGGMLDVSKAYVITAVAIASAFVSRANVLMFPTSRY